MSSQAQHRHESSRSTRYSSLVFALLVSSIAALKLPLGSFALVETMEFLAFIRHYVAYLSSPGGILALFLVLPLLYIIWSDNLTRTLRKTPSPETTVPGCVRYGVHGRSNLYDQYDAAAIQACSDADRLAQPQVKAIFAYPIKSCRGIELPAAEITATGLRYDRFLSFAQLVTTRTETPLPKPSGFNDVGTEWEHRWRSITQREFPRLALLETELWIPDPRKVENDADDPPVDRISDWRANGGCLIVRFPYRQGDNWASANAQVITLRIPLDPTSERAEAKGYEVTNMTIWRDYPQAIDVSNEIDPNATKHRGSDAHELDWSSSLRRLQHFLGVRNPLGLFRVDSTQLRKITRSLPKDRANDQFEVGFADAFPVHLLSLASRQAIDDEMPLEATSKGQLDIRRFRANVVVSGIPAFAEDQWKKIKFGLKVNPDGTTESAQYHVACRTARCVLVNVDQTTGIKDRREPVSTLQQTRQVDEGAKPHPCLGLSMIPLLEHGIVRVGDDIAVLETGEHYYEKMFA